ncbi:TetR/AcrR family transcriptional regulator [Streptomyces sp. NBC_00893]|uniref:TetR/AcrR family transcriptional regulator n=1 Tax=Streptomyces sp. NBC_00893 TaxID=2975862 RepID=UPI002255CA15|nr:TetR/AcrR family transcriptional regulator [Streptomyces sp. NBC_00893]MCX4849530.1 TetR/AcrR family transcriptional regulator [Streptomyces sp. NBC_00893]
MRPPASPHGKGGNASTLSQQVIIDAAQRILDEEGHQSLSMRRLARSLSITPMALYHHVRDKDELLILLLAKKAQSYPRPELPEEPRERLVAASQLLYDLMSEAAFLSEILASPDLLAVSVSWITDHITEAAAACGLIPEQATRAQQLIWRFTAGELMAHRARERLRAKQEQEQDAAAPASALAEASPEQHPRITAVADRWPDLIAQNTHRRGLEDIVDGILASYRPDARASG